VFSIEVIRIDIAVATVNPILWGLGYPVPGGNKYRNLSSRLGGVSKIETIKCAHESRETQTRSRLYADDAQKQLKTIDFSSERAPHINKPATV
jgi:hypothetical protein